MRGSQVQLHTQDMENQESDSVPVTISQVSLLYKVQYLKFPEERSINLTNNNVCNIKKIL